MSGFYLLHRDWMDNKLFSSVKRDPLCKRAAWVWMIEHAAFAGEHRGHLTFSVRYLGVAWGWPATKVFRFLKACVSEKMIECSSGTGQIDISVCNYEAYQFSGRNGETSKPVTVKHERNDSGTNIKEGEEGKEEEDPLTGVSNLPREMADIWSHECGDVLPKVKRLTPQRIQKLKARLKELGGELEAWRDVCRRVRRSHFLTEQWKATIDWALEPANLVKIQEGNYDDRATPIFGKRQSAHDAETAAFRWVVGADDSGADREDDAPLLDAAGAV